MYRRSSRPSAHQHHGLRLQRSSPGSSAGRFHGAVGLPRRLAAGVMLIVVSDDRHARPLLLDRLHARRRGLLALLRLPEPLHVLDAHAHPGRQLPARLPRLGGRGPVLVPADRLLVPQEERQRRRARRPSSSTASATWASRSASSLIFVTTRHAAVQPASSPRRRHVQLGPASAWIACCSSPAPWARAPSSRCTSGCRTRWRAPPRSAPSSTPPPWSTPASTWSPAATRSSASSHTAMLVVMVRRHLHRHLRRLHRVHPERHQEGHRLLHPLVARATCSWPSGAGRLGGGHLPPVRATASSRACCSSAPARSSTPCRGEQDMRKMGGLRKKIPITFWTMLIGALAIVGMFPFAGFWAKDEILGGDLRRTATTWSGRRLRHRLRDRALHVPPHVPDLLGREPRRRRGAGTTSTSRRAS